MGVSDLSDLLKLDLGERLVIAERLFESVAAEAERLPLDAAERQFIESRLREHAAAPDDHVPWEDVKKVIGL